MPLTLRNFDKFADWGMYLSLFYDVEISNIYIETGGKSCGIAG